MADQIPNRPLVTVGGLVVAPDRELLLLRSHKWKDLYTVPGGKVDLGESCLEAFRREVLEETGLALERVEYALMIESIFSKEFWREGFHFVMHEFVGYLEQAADKRRVRLNEEAEDFLWVSLEEAKKMELNRETKLLIDWFEKRC